MYVQPRERVREKESETFVVARKQVGEATSPSSQVIDRLVLKLCSNHRGDYFFHLPIKILLIVSLMLSPEPVPLPVAVLFQHLQFPLMRNQSK